MVIGVDLGSSAAVAPTPKSLVPAFARFHGLRPISTHRLHRNSFLGMTLQDPKYEPKKGPTMEPMGRASQFVLLLGMWFPEAFPQPEYLEDLGPRLLKTAHRPLSSSFVVHI